MPAPEVPWIDWYGSLVKPSWTPAPRTMGLIWQILYPIIIATFGYVFVQAGRGRVPLLVALPFAINLVANLIFTPILFGMRNMLLASADILVVWGTPLWMTLADCGKSPLRAFEWGATLRPRGLTC